MEIPDLAFHPHSEVNGEIRVTETPYCQRLCPPVPEPTEGFFVVDL